MMPRLIASTGLYKAALRYQRARDDAAQAKASQAVDDFPPTRYIERDPYIRDRATNWVNECRTAYLKALANECERRDHELGDGASTDVDLPNLVALSTAHNEERGELVVQMDLRTAQQQQATLMR